MVGHLVDVILGNAPLAAAGRDGPDPVHEMRVAVRRLRSMLALFRPAIGCPAVDAASLLLKSLAERLAPAREWDVFVTETVAAVAAALPDDPALRRLSRAAERRRRQAYAALRDWLRSPAFRRAGISLAGLAGDRVWLPQPEPSQMEAQALGLDGFARHALTRRLRRLTSPAHRSNSSIRSPCTHSGCAQNGCVMPRKRSRRSIRARPRAGSCGGSPPCRTGWAI